MPVVTTISSDSGTFLFKIPYCHTLEMKCYSAGFDTLVRQFLTGTDTFYTHDLILVTEAIGLAEINVHKPALSFKGDKIIVDAK
jgi:hypothetical protein